MRFSILPLALLTSTVLADGASIIAAISKISSSTSALNQTVTNFPTGPLGLLFLIPLLSDSIHLLNDINEGTKVATASGNLTFNEAIEVATATVALAGVVETTLDTVVAAKPRFDAGLIVSPILLLNLKQQRAATDEFSAAVVAKVPEALQAVAVTLIAPIDAAFDEAIAAYNPFD